MRRAGSKPRMQRTFGFRGLCTQRRTGFHRCAQRIVAFVDPVHRDGLEGRAHVIGIEGLEEIHLGVAMTLAVGAREDVHGAVVVLRTEDIVEEDPAVEEAPADVAHHRAQEAVHFDGVHALRPADVDEVGITLEGETAEGVLAVAQHRIRCGGDDLDFLDSDGVHDVSSMPHFSTQISDHFSTLSGPAEVWISATEGFAAFSW